MLEFKGLENKLRQLEIEAVSKGKMTTPLKGLLLEIRANLAMLKEQYNYIEVNFLGGANVGERE